MVDIRQTIQYANYLTKIGWVVERVGEINYFIKKLPLVGSIIKVQRPEEIRINKIKELTIKYRGFQIIIEPKTELDAKFLTSMGFKLSKSPYLPTKTLQLDLTKIEKILLKSLKKDAKGAINKNKQLETTNEQDLEKFRYYWKKAVGWKRYVPPTKHLLALRKSFKKNSLFLISENYSAGAVFLMSDDIAYYWQAFTGKEGRKLQMQYKIVWEGILWAKSSGAKVFDFEGIYDERFPNKSWLGFTHFKKSFGGIEVEYLGAFVKWFL